jgi:diguanylate cyclase (GGDEF)-like protein
MNDNKPDPSQRTQGVEPQAVLDGLRKLERQQWSLWSTTILVLILLALGLASFAFPAMLDTAQYSYSFDLNLAVRALVGIVLVFNVYLVYQQLQISRMRRLIADQIQSLAKVERLTAEVYKLAALDQLTGLYNRRSGEQRLEEEISRARRYGCPLTLLLVDLDGLKQINDTLGHAAGDHLLRSFAERLLRAVRGSDVAARIGGDEFMVLLPECRSEEVSHVLGRMEGLRVAYGGQEILCRFSRGWVDFKPGETAQQFLERADGILYANKRAGRQQNETEQSSPVPKATLCASHQ